MSNQSILGASSRNWQDDAATVAQIKTIRKMGLASESDIQSMTKGQASGLLTKALGNKTGIERAREAKALEPTEAQIRLLEELIDTTGEILDLTKLNRKSASTEIDRLRTLVQSPIGIEEGLYMISDAIYKVRRSERGYLYAMLLTALTHPEHISNGVRTHKFMPAPGSINKIRKHHKLTREQAKKFGQETHSCVRCGTQLNPTIKAKDGSERYIGPECERKMGWQS